MNTTRHRRFRNILCPVDFSTDARTALRFAAAVAQRGGGHVTVLFVNDPLLVAAAAVAYDERVLAETTESELRRFVESGVGPTRATTVKTLVAFGDPAREIDKAAHRLRCDLVVLGFRGLGRAGKLFFGSTAERVLRHAKVPTLVVPRAAGRRGAPARSWPTRLLAAVVLGTHAAADVRAATSVAQWFKSHMLLVTVVAPAQTPSWLRLRASDRDRARVVAARTTLRALAARTGGKALAVRVLVGDPADQIASTATDTRAGLIVVRLRPSDRLLGARQGSVTYRVLSRAAMPVLALTEHPPAVRH